MSAADVKMLESRVRDLLDAADGGRLAVSRYLTEREQLDAMELITRLKATERTVLFGGYPDAQRKKLFCLPEYVLGLGKSGEDVLAEYFSDELASHTVALRIMGSEYRALKHGDYLGAILNLGCERDSLGDVCVTGEHEAWAFCEESVARLIESDLSRIATDGVRVRRMNGLEAFSFEVKLVRVSDTVASARADCVVAALASVSRERAKEMISGGFVEINYREELRPDRQIESGAVVTVRKKGKFIIRSLDGRTSKGRIRLVADKYC